MPFIGIGNPVLEGQPEAARGVKLATLFRGGFADVAAVRQLSPLPESAEELRAVAKAMRAEESDLYLAERASEPLLRQAGLDKYRIVEFATHGLMSGDLKGLAEPALVLTPPAEAGPDNDGLLTASKVATLKLNADWVVLSACNTAAADGSPDAGGLSGLAKAFFYAGARSLLVSHWSVESKATVKLITDAFAELEKDPKIGRAEALRRAAMTMLDPSNPPEFAHPLMWAPFVLAGEGGAGR
jgi:CHAT domain-containing protein